MIEISESNMNHQIDEILEWFNWEKVHKTMAFLNWTWVDSNAPPTIEDLKKTAIEYLKRVANEDIASTSCGGLKATKRNTEEGVFLDLEFILEDWHTGA